MPSRSMNAPKSVRFLTTPLTVEPILMVSMKRWRFSARSASMSSRRERTTFFAVVVDFDDLEVVGVAHELLEIFRGDDVDLRSGQERLDADVDGEARFDDGFDFAFDEAIALEDLDDLFPVLAVGGFFLGEDDRALVVFEAQDQHFHFVTDLEIVGVVKLAQTRWRPRICNRLSTSTSRGRTSRMRPLTICPSLNSRKDLASRSFISNMTLLMSLPRVTNGSFPPGQCQYGRHQ